MKNLKKFFNRFSTSFGSKENLQHDYDYPCVDRYTQITNTERTGQVERVIIDLAEFDSGPHREMAVDVPDSFVARRKTPPRYPPPVEPCPVSPGACKYSAALQRVSSGADTVSAPDLQALQAIFRKPGFQSALELYQKLEKASSLVETSETHRNTRGLVAECVRDLQSCISSFPEAVELVEVLCKFRTEGLLYTCDKIASRVPVEDSSNTPGCQEKAENVPDTPNNPQKTPKTVRLEKSNEPLGATVKTEGTSVVIARIIRGGIAERSGLLHEGDHILQINGISITGKSVNEVCDLVERVTGTITLLVLPAEQNKRLEVSSRQSHTVVHLRALFDYDPEDDIYIPCKELGMSFRKGDILHVIGQDDPDWWQAFREGEDEQTLPGLIPSKNFQLDRENFRRSLIIEHMEDLMNSKSKLFCSGKVNRKKKRLDDLTEYSTDEVLTYEEVALFYPKTKYKRPIVLIGPPNVGRKEIRENLMRDSERFCAAVPHTTRAPRDGEIDGRDYHFVSRTEFEAKILESKFLEFGEYDRHLYGTSYESVKSVAASGKFCVLNLRPESLIPSRESKLFPFVVFVVPPLPEQQRLRSTNFHKEDELRSLNEKAQEIEEKYGHLFDMIIVNDNQQTSEKIAKEINRLETDPQWVPASWTVSNTIHF